MNTITIDDPHVFMGGEYSPHSIVVRPLDW